MRHIVKREEVASKAERKDCVSDVEAEADVRPSSENSAIVEGGQNSAEKQYYAYILLCADNTLYSGFTTDLKRREATHNSGHGAKYTRARRPVQMVYHETFATKHDAMHREAEFKRLSREEKIDLIAGQNPKAAAQIRENGDNQ